MSVAQRPDGPDTLSILHQMPPHCPDSERALLGSILNDADGAALAAAGAFLGTSDFWVSEHAALFRALLDMAGRGEPLDLVQACESLRERGELEALGGLLGIRAIMDSVPLHHDARKYATLVKEASRKRALIELSDSLRRRVYGRHEAADDLLAEFRGQLDRIAADRPAVAGDGYATMADVGGALGETRWLWEGWIARGSMSLLAGRGGEGKTRFALDLARRLWHGLPWPDGSINPYPAGTRTLWIPVDRNWGETLDTIKDFGIPPEAILLNTRKGSPLTLPELDNPRTIRDLAEQIRAERPAMVDIDTMTYATAHNTAKAEEARAAFDPVMDMAASCSVAVLALTHLNKEGEALNRRITERARSVLSLSCPDPEGQPDRRRLWVSKSALQKPAPLGITIGKHGNEYDDKPPREPEKGKPGPSPKKSIVDAEWLLGQLDPYPSSMKNLIDAARDAGILKPPLRPGEKGSLSPLYNAKDRVPEIRPGYRVEIYDVPENGTSRKYWGLIADGEGPVIVPVSDAPADRLTLTVVGESRFWPSPDDGATGGILF